MSDLSPAERAAIEARDAAAFSTEPPTLPPTIADHDRRRLLAALTAAEAEVERLRAALPTWTGQVCTCTMMTHGLVLHREDCWLYVPAGLSLGGQQP